MLTPCIRLVRVFEVDIRNSWLLGTAPNRQLGSRISSKKGNTGLQVPKIGIAMFHVESNTDDKTSKNNKYLTPLLDFFKDIKMHPLRRVGKETIRILVLDPKDLPRPPTII